MEIGAENTMCFTQVGRIGKLPTCFLTLTRDQRMHQLREVHQPTKEKVLQWKWVVVWSAVILLISILPSFLLPPNEENVLWTFSMDKVGHFAVYAILAGLIAWTWRHQSWKARFAAALITSSLYGVLLECAQLLLTTSRHFEIDDIIANIIGSLCGSLLTIFYIVKNNNV
ncbi:MAG: VanZ family protein [Saprospiraceae bacterium]|nr:VanZ family protein [Saprospiraceae bacterium]